MGDSFFDEMTDLVFVQIKCSGLGVRRMRDIPGTPGTITGFILRIVQFCLAVASLYLMSLTCGFMVSIRDNLINLLSLQIGWSSTMFFSYFWICTNCVHDTMIINALIMIGDAVIAFFGLAFASASFGVAMYSNSNENIRHNLGGPCPEIWMSLVFALLSCSTNFASFLVILWAIAKQ